MKPPNTSMVLSGFVLALVLSVFQARAVDQFDVGPLHLNLSNAGWTQTEPPVELQNGYAKAPQNVKLIFHATSSAAKLRFHITEVDFSNVAVTNIPAAIAGLLDGTKRRCQRQASGDVREEKGTVGETPYAEFDADVPGGFFLKIRSILFADRVYLLEISGPGSSKSEAETAIAGVVINESKPADSEAAKAIAAVRKSSPITTERQSYELGRKIGYWFGVAILLAAVLIVVILIFSKSRRRYSGVVSKPPPVPPVAKN